MRGIDSLTPRPAWPLIVLTALACGCGASDGGAARSQGMQQGSPGTPVVGLPSGAPGAGAIAPGSGVGAMSTMTSAPTATGSAGAAAPISGGVPCEVATVVSTHCTTCHTNPPSFGAPMSLMTYADFHAQAKSDASKLVYQMIPARINATDVTRRMPPASGTALSANELQALNDWVNGGALSSAQSCAITPAGSGTTGTSGAAGAGGGAMPATHMGGESPDPIEYNDPLMKCYQFLSHDPGDKTQPFTTPTTPDLYNNFDFMAPWQGTVYGRSFKTVVGNMAAIHHWILYKDNAPVTDGAISSSTGAHPDGQFVTGWAPGASDMYLDPDVGVELPSDVGYTLETHHNNTTGAPAPDASGVEVCVTPTKPANVASIAFLGTDAINGTVATGTCAPTSGVPAHIISTMPHMHLKGTRMTAIITRADGTQETLHDQPFDFNYQHSYPENAVINPGDSLATTCYYNAPATYGSKTTDEMCYLFTLYYPPLSLTSNNPLAAAIHGVNNCM